jgi:hypothetical protein
MTILGQLMACHSFPVNGMSLYEIRPTGRYASLVTRYEGCIASGYRLGYREGSDYRPLVGTASQNCPSMCRYNYFTV